MENNFQLCDMTVTYNVQLMTNNLQFTNYDLQTITNNTLGTWLSFDMENNISDITLGHSVVYRIKCKITWSTVWSNYSVQKYSVQWVQCAASTVFRK